MEEKQELETPEVTTYDREELDLDIALTGTLDSDKGDQ
jgi:hypothetical protein